MTFGEQGNDFDTTVPAVVVVRAERNIQMQLQAMFDEQGADYGTMTPAVTVALAEEEDN